MSKNFHYEISNYSLAEIENFPKSLKSRFTKLSKTMHDTSIS